MMFDTTYRVGGAIVELQPDESGDIHEIHVIMPVLAALPVGPGQMALMQMGVLRLPMDHDIVENLVAQLTEAQESLKPRSQIQTATDMSQAEAIAEMRRQVEGFRG